MRTRFRNHVTLLELYSWKRAPPMSGVATESGGVGGWQGAHDHTVKVVSSKRATVQFNHTHTIFLFSEVCLTPEQLRGCHRAKGGAVDVGISIQGEPSLSTSTSSKDKSHVT